MALRTYLEDLMVRIPLRDFFLDPVKIILVVSPNNVPYEEAYFRGMGLHLVTISRYPGACIGNQAAEMEWLEGKVQDWTASVDIMERVVHIHLQTAYAGLQKSLQ